MRLSLAVFALSLALLNGNAARSPPVKLTLRSSWPAAPVLVEVIESVVLENPDAFFPLLNILSNPESISHSQTLTSEAIHHYVLQTAMDNGFLPDPGSLAAVKMNLALHAATPKIEAFYEHYVDYTGRRVESQSLGCESWVDWYGKTVCDVETLVHLAGLETIESAPHPPFTRPKVLPFDHIYPSRTLEHPPRTAIFYASLTSPGFWDLHTYLFSLASKPEPHVEYVFRHIPSGPRNLSKRNYLSGYGVALDLKKMDYLALDDRHHRAAGSGKKVSDEEPGDSPPDLDHIISLLQTYPENATAADATFPLTADELFDLGLQATQLLADSSNPFRTLTQLSQNFPKYATSIARRVVVNESLAREVHVNHMKAEPGVNAVWLNGATVNLRDVNPFGLLRLLRKERRLMLSLTSLGLSREQAIELLTHPAIATAQSGNTVLDGLFDASDRPEGGDVIIWWNDFEKDDRYARWNPNLSALLRPLYPGQFHNVKSNLFNVVLALDLSQTSSLNFIAAAVSNIIDRNFPFRFGVVPIAETEEGTRMARLFYHLIKQYGRAKTMAFIKRIAQTAVPINLLTPTANWNLVRFEYQALLTTETPREEGLVTDFDIIIKGASDVLTSPVEKARGYAERLGTDLASSSQGHAFVNGKHLKVDDGFLRLMQIEVGQQLQYLQEKLYEGELERGDASMTNYFYDLPGTIHRRNRHIYPTTTSSLRVFSLPDLFSKSGFPVSHESFVYPSQVEPVPLSLFVVADLNSDSGLQLIKEVLKSIGVESLMRVSFVHNPTHPTGDLSTRSPISWIIAHLISTGSLSKTSPEKLLRALSLGVTMTSGENPQVVLSQEDTLQELTGGVAIKEFDASEYTRYVKSSRLVAHELQFAPGELALMVNGRVVGPFKSGEFVSADVKALEAYEFRLRTEPVAQALLHILPPDHDKAWFANLVSMSASVLAAIQLPDPSENGLFDTAPRPRQRNYQLLSGDHTLFQFGDNSTALYQLAVLLEPLSEAAQIWSSLLEWLTNLPDIYVELHISPSHYSELPLKRFYRYNVLPSLLFGEDGSEIPAQAIFQDLPIEPIYTLAMEVPPSWLVRPREALYDLDNIQLGSVSPEDQYSGVEALFDLDYLVVEGHARDTHTSAPPRGVQLHLTTSNSTTIDDTQVVANLGYFQFKAKPGVFQLEIREGRGRDIFRMESVGNEGWHSPLVEDVGNEITLTSFEGLTLYPRLARLPGMQTADVLSELESPSEKESKGFFDDIMSSIFGSQSEGNLDVKVRSNEQADINIFTVASGLLYERFVAIMILSVLRNTNSTVKFWFIENFLSPSFLEFIPHLAEAYGFKYELVTYKWPSWLRAQKEKQRIIWAYKILFLDVLFPMDLKKVIFVDADQIVRADLKELVDLDLQGAPYGYTPMGDDNADMEGFRFWKTGYWREFLQGRPYHISALYVVDLVRFRQMAAGDILRGQYQQLSADPNSLANLDQDLPNNLQREVPIFSLHEDWLWCETWCSKDRLHRAKTIDLCQNPLTKEPKLARARQILEWEEYDSEISRFARKLAEQGVIHSRVAIADVNTLANAGVAPEVPPPAEEREEHVPVGEQHDEL